LSDIVGKTFSNNAGQKYEVLRLEKIKPNKTKVYRIRFTDTGYERDIEPVEIKRGKIKDKLSKSVFGVGILGDVKMVNFKREYMVWNGMLERCYDMNSRAYKSYGGRGVTVDEKWHTFTNFLQDITNIEGYEKDLFEKGELHLDKDIKQSDIAPENKVYSFDTCKFVSFEENNKHRNYDRRKKTFFALSPNGVVTEVFGLKEFARQNNLERVCIGRCINNKQTIHQGWKFSYRKEDLLEIN
jgi:hypothetical protein